MSDLNALEYLKDFDESIQEKNVEDARVALQMARLESAKCTGEKRKELDARLFKARFVLDRMELLEKKIGDAPTSISDPMRILLQARQQLTESELQACETLENLQAQKEVLIGTSSKLKESGEKLTTSAKILTKMSAFWR
jgi:hypothetical protein